MIYATPVAADPRDCARAARRSAAIAAPLMSLGAGLLLAATTFMDPAKTGSVPQAMAVDPMWAAVDRLLVALGLAAVAAATVLAVTALRDRDARRRLGRHVLSASGYAWAAFVLAPWMLTTFGDYRLGPDDWARPSAVLLAVTAGMTAAGAALVGSAHRGSPAPMPR